VFKQNSLKDIGGGDWTDWTDGTGGSDGSDWSDGTRARALRRDKQFNNAIAKALDDRCRTMGEDIKNTPKYQDLDTESMLPENTACRKTNILSCDIWLTERERKTAARLFELNDLKKCSKFPFFSEKLTFGQLFSTTVHGLCGDVHWIYCVICSLIMEMKNDNGNFLPKSAACFLLMGCNIVCATCLLRGYYKRNGYQSR
jgi:hypothetical protein